MLWHVSALETGLRNVVTGLELRPVCPAPIRGAFPVPRKSSLWRHARCFRQPFGPAAARRTLIGRNEVNPAIAQDKMLWRAVPMR
jgi:hypothetical protein